MGSNAKIGGADRTGRIRLRATKDIAAGSEIYGHYGRGYWKNRYVSLN